MIRIVLPAALLVAGPALAHTGILNGHSFASGLLHPLAGLDHVLAMGAVGLWAGLVGGAARYAWPLAFIIVMIAGSLIGLTGFHLPGAEFIIAFTVGLLGLFVAVRAPMPALAGALLCGVFAFAHGFVHGNELPPGGEAATYVMGFTLGTAFLHATGLAFGTALVHLDRGWIPCATGTAIAATGLVMLMGT